MRVSLGVSCRSLPQAYCGRLLSLALRSFLCMVLHDAQKHSWF